MYCEETGDFVKDPIPHDDHFNNMFKKLKLNLKASYLAWIESKMLA